MERKDKSKEWLNENECLPYIDLLTEFISKGTELFELADEVDEQESEKEKKIEAKEKNKGI